MASSKHKRKPSPCRRCRMARVEDKAKARGNFAKFYATRADTQLGFYNITAAELILRLAPRESVVVPVGWLRRELKRHPPTIIKRHLPHVNNDVPGILATVTHQGRTHRTLIEGFHRATNHVREGTGWRCHILTAEESYAILTP
jgi:hypothetical protein